MSELLVYVAGVVSGVVIAIGFSIWTERRARERFELWQKLHG